MEAGAAAAEDRLRRTLLLKHPPPAKILAPGTEQSPQLKEQTHSQAEITEYPAEPGFPGSIAQSLGSQGAQGQAGRRGITASEDLVLKSCPSDTFSSVPERKSSPPQAGRLITRPAWVGRAPWKLITEI